ncbi:response regulator [Parasedimentitalea marina]|nr:response regulator [Parasedimentitalea marina]
MRKLVQSIAFRLSIPIPFFFLLCMAIAWVAIPRVLEKNTIAFATSSATNMANQIKIIRGYYTQNVVMDVEAASDISVGIKHEIDTSIIPLPATFVHDISKLFVDQDISLSLYSPLPFPGRADRQMDNFMQEAWIYLNDNPEGTYTRRQDENGNTILRVAVADRMVAEACISCHNSHPDTRKSDWKIGDVRGVLEVRQNIQGALITSLELTHNILFGVAATGLGLLLVVWFITRTITRPISEICESMDVLATGNLDSDIPTANRGDELGWIGKTLANLKDDLKRARTAAGERSEQMAALLDALPDNYFRIDNQGTILEYRVRPGAGSVNDPVAFLGRRMAEVFPPVPLALFEENMRKQQSTREMVTWEYYLEFEGERKDREAHLCPISGSDEMVLVVRDVSERRQAERQRAHAEAHLERIVASLPGAVISRRSTKSEGIKIIYVSSQSTDLWGYSPEESYGEHDVLGSTIDPKNRRELKRIMRNAIDNFETYSYRYQITTKDGERKWLETCNNCVLHEDGSVFNDGFIRDVTAEVTAQNQLEAHRKLTNHAQKLESMGQLTGGMAHDFNNVLATIMFSLELLRDNETVVEQLSLIEVALTAAQRGAQLTSSMLAFASKAHLEPSVINLNALVNETHNWAGRTLPSNIEVTTSLLADLWQIRADVSSIENALLNLFVNARDAMPDGGMLTIKTSNIVIDEGYLDARQQKMSPGRYVVLAVSDTGHGIPSEILEHIFEPFFTTKEPEKGTGLGLATIFGFMQQSGGTVQVYSKLNFGTTFELFFKAVTEELEITIEEPTQAANHLGQGQKILLAEDDKNVLPILVATLEKAGYHVTAANSGDKALELFEANPTFDLLLTDIMMPGKLKGIALSRAVREIEPELPVVFLSGYAREATDQGNGFGPEDICLTKPVRRADLLAAIKKSLNG